MTPDELHKERGATHGDFREQFDIAQRLKVALGPRKLHPIQREALDMIMTKVSRIVTGNPDEPDHWEDIAGYAMLPAKLLREKAAQTAVAPFAPVDAYRKAQAEVEKSQPLGWADRLAQDGEPVQSTVPQKRLGDYEPAPSRVHWSPNKYPE